MALYLKYKLFIGYHLYAPPYSCSLPGVTFIRHAIPKVGAADGRAKGRYSYRWGRVYNIIYNYLYITLTITYIIL